MIILALQAAPGISTVNVTRTIQDVIQYAERVNLGCHSKFTLAQQPLKDERVKVNQFRFSLFARLEDTAARLTLSVGTKRARNSTAVLALLRLGTQQLIDKGRMGAFVRYRPDALKGHWNVIMQGENGARRQVVGVASECR